MPSVREGLESAIEALEQHDETQTPEVKVEAPAIEVKEPTGEDLREPVERISTTPAAPNPAAIAGEEARVTEVQRPEPPRSWKADKRAVWDKLDPETAAYINQRETEQTKGFEDYRATREPIYRAVEPYVGELRQRGFDPEKLTQELFYTHRLLSSGDEATRLQTIVNIAHASGIPLGQMLQQSAALTPQMQHHLDPNVMAANQRARNAEYQMSQIQTAQHAQGNASADQAIADFAQSHEHFEALRPVMAQLIQTGMAQDLDSAYSKALRLNEKLFEQSQATQRAAAEQQRRTEADKAAKAAKANAVSTRSATPGNAANGVAPKGRRESLEAAFDQITTSRI